MKGITILAYFTTLYVAEVIRSCNIFKNHVLYSDSYLDTSPLVHMLYQDAYDANQSVTDQDGNEIPFGGVCVLFNVGSLVAIQQGLGVEP